MSTVGTVPLSLSVVPPLGSRSLKKTGSVLSSLQRQITLQIDSMDPAMRVELRLSPHEAFPPRIVMAAGQCNDDVDATRRRQGSQFATSDGLCCAELSLLSHCYSKLHHLPLGRLMVYEFPEHKPRL